MALPSVNINQLSGKSGRPLQGYDHYCGMIFYGTAPVVSGKWKTYNGTVNIKAQQIFSSADAISAGILPFTDNTAPTSTITPSVKGNTGDDVEFYCEIPKANSTSDIVTLCSYTVPVASSTIALQIIDLAALVNAGTVNHGFSATYTSTVLTIIAPKSCGVSLNSGTPYSMLSTGAFAASVVQNVISGTASNFAIWYYHISEHFRKFPDSNLTVSISTYSSFNEIETLQKVASNSRLRQIGIFDTDATRGSAANITGTISLIDIAAKKCQKTSPLQVVYSPNIFAVSDLSTYPDQNLNTANKIQTVISQDGAGAGALLFVQSGKTIGSLGVKLATIASSRVSASDAQPTEQFNVSDGVENDLIAYGNGVLDVNMTENLKSQLDSYNYTFLRKFGDTLVGSYWTGNKCCVNASSDYANVNDNRVSDKVSRICYSTYIPLLASELIFNEDGTLTDYSIEAFIDAGESAITNNMITGYGSLPLIGGVSVTIDSTQPVKQTSNLTIGVVINENGIARNITVNISF